MKSLSFPTRISNQLLPAQLTTHQLLAIMRLLTQTLAIALAAMPFTMAEPIPAAAVAPVNAEPALELVGRSVLLHPRQQLPSCCSVGFSVSCDCGSCPILTCSVSWIFALVWKQCLQDRHSIFLFRCLKRFPRMCATADMILATVWWERLPMLGGGKLWIFGRIWDLPVQ